MILAKEKYDYRSWEAAKEGPQQKVKKAVNTKQQQKTQMGYLMIVLLAFVIGIVIAARYTQLSVAGYGLNKINKELTLLQKENQQLSVELNHLKSLERIEEIATTKLGMVPPQRVQFVTMTAAVDQDATQVKQTAMIGNHNATILQANQDQSIIGALTVLFRGNAQAEAGTRN